VGVNGSVAKAGASSRIPKGELQVEVEGALVMEESKITENIGFDFFRFRLAIDLLEFADDLLNGMLAITPLNDFEARTIQAQSALGHQKEVLLVVFA
jgi:hypothetical protein